jgi:hypothetical protein
MPEYWNAFQGIDSTPILTKAEASDAKKTLSRRLPSDARVNFRIFSLLVNAISRNAIRMRLKNWKTASNNNGSD